MAPTVFIDPDGSHSPYLAVIVQHPTGVTYEQQCAGTECCQRAVEGFYVPLGGVQSNPDDGLVDISALTAPFHRGDACVFGGSYWPGHDGESTLPSDRLALLSAVVRTIRYWSETSGPNPKTVVTCLTLDMDRLPELAEAWVPVLTPDGPGILTWPNCD